MKKHYWIGSALGLALYSVTLASCSGGNQLIATDGNASASSDGQAIALKSSDEKQIRDAIAQAPQHGLRSDLFLKGGESGPALAQAALKYASALANGYSDPKKLFEVYTIPRNNVDVRAGLQQALQKGNVGEWLNSLAPQTDEYKALSQAFVRYAKLAGQGDSSRSRATSRSSRARATTASRRSSPCFGPAGTSRTTIRRSSKARTSNRPLRPPRGPTRLRWWRR